MEDALRQDSRNFIAERARRQGQAMQRVALQIIAGIDIDDLARAAPEEKRRAALRLTRLIERERLKGAARHWSYDLNRHIALKQALDRIEGRTAPAAPTGKPKRRRGDLPEAAGFGTGTRLKAKA